MGRHEKGRKDTSLTSKCGEDHVQSENSTLSGLSNSEGTNQENRSKSNNTTTAQNERWGVKTRKETRALAS